MQDFGVNLLMPARLIRMILKNLVYCGKIAYGRRKTEKVHETRNEYRLVEQESYLLVDGLHEAIIPEDVWQAAQVKLATRVKRYEHVNKGKNECTHLLSGIVKCPVCGVGMYGNKCVKRKEDGSKYKINYNTRVAYYKSSIFFSFVVVITRYATLFVIFCYKNFR